MGGLPRRRQDCMCKVLLLLGRCQRTQYSVTFRPHPVNSKTEVGGCVNKQRRPSLTGHCFMGFTRFTGISVFTAFYCFFAFLRVTTYVPQNFGLPAINW